MVYFLKLVILVRKRKGHWHRLATLWRCSFVLQQRRVAITPVRYGQENSILPWRKQYGSSHLFLLQVVGAISRLPLACSLLPTTQCLTTTAPNAIGGWNPATAAHLNWNLKTFTWSITQTALQIIWLYVWSPVVSSTAPISPTHIHAFIFIFEIQGRETLKQNIHVKNSNKRLSLLSMAWIIERIGTLSI